MKIAIAVILVTITGCYTPPPSQTEREYVQTHDCKVDGYYDYAPVHKRIYTQLNGIKDINADKGGFTAYLCSNGVTVYVDYGK